MRFSPDSDFGSYTIRSYQGGQVIVIPPSATGEPPAVKELLLTRSFVISPSRLIQNWPPQSLAELTFRHLDAIFEQKPELVILGTGKVLQFPGPVISRVLNEKGIGVEIMDTAAACRTYNVLMHEGREVVAAVIID